MERKKLEKPGVKEFERVDWGRYKDALGSSIRTEVVPFLGLRTSRYLQTEYGELNLGKLEDRQYIRETQRTIRPEYAQKIYGLFEAVVLEIASFLKSRGIRPGESEFGRIARDYAESIASDLKAAESAVLSLMPAMPAEKRAEYQAMSGKGLGGYKN